eukprot:scaffold24393_cov176-Cylindrotheca_fusiformis.AAC.3
MGKSTTTPIQQQQQCYINYYGIQQQQQGQSGRNTSNGINLSRGGIGSHLFVWIDRHSYVFGWKWSSLQNMYQLDVATDIEIALYDYIGCQSTTT